MLRTTAIALLTFALLTTATPLGAETADEPAEARVVFLVRHAESDAGGRDPSLSAAGAERVKALRTALADAGIEHVHSTDYARTRQTATVLSDAPTLYDPRKLGALVRKLKDAAGRHLIVGHSNTTTDVVRRLGGDPGPPIDDASEFDRMYVVTLGPDGTVTTVRLRYGAPE